MRFDYLEGLGMKLGGQARRVFNNILNKWDHAYADNAVTREASRDVGRAFYKRKAIFDSRQIHVAARGKATIRPDVLENLVEELAELEEFLAIMHGTF